MQELDGQDRIMILKEKNKKERTVCQKKEFHNDNVVLDIHDRPTVGHWVGLSLQHLFTMFGATVLYQS